LIINIRIENLGIIREAELEIRPFTVFIGENNTNKSWTAYSIYGIFHNDLARELTKDYLSLGEVTYIAKSELKEFILDTINRITKSDSNSIEIKEIDKVFENLVDSFFKDLSDLFSNFYISKLFKLSYEDFFKNTNIKLGISKRFKKLATRALIEGSVEIGAKTRKNEDIIKIYKSRGENTLIIEGNINEDVPLKHFKRLLSELILEFFHSNLFMHRNVFPSERKALTTLEEHLSGGFLDKVRDKEDIPYEVFLNFYIKRELSFPKLMEDFLFFVNKLGTPLEQISSKKYQILVKELEKIIGGKVIYDRTIKKYIVFVPNNDNTEIPVYSTSSMVKSLSTFYLYLEKFASGKDLIIIDEPEMNLHPKAQAEFLELLTAFINESEENHSNFVITTTHTPYILDHLENLMDAYDLEKTLRKRYKEKYQELLTNLRNEFFLKTEKSFIDPHKISAYYFSPDGKVEDIFDREDRRFYKSTFAKIGGEIIRIEDFLERIEGELEE